MPTSAGAVRFPSARCTRRSGVSRATEAMVGEAEPGAGPDRKRYTITQEGKSEVEVWLAEPIPGEPHFQTELFVKVVLSLMLNLPAEQYLDVQRTAHLARMRELTDVKRKAGSSTCSLPTTGSST